MVFKYSPSELIAIGEMVILKECLNRVSKQNHKNDSEPQYHPVYVPPAYETCDPERASSSISADHFLQDFAQFHHNLDQSIQMNRDTNWQTQSIRANREQKKQLTSSVAEFFRKAQQNFNPTPSPDQSESNFVRARRLSEVEAELLGQLKGHIHL